MKKLISILGISALLLVGCGGNDDSKDSKEDKKIIVGASTTPHAEVLEEARADIEDAGYTLEIITFDDYVTPNKSLVEGDLDANFFQHKPYLDAFNEEEGKELQSVGEVFFSPIGIYSKDTTERNEKFSIDDVKEGAKISVPNDPTNEARALQLLANAKIITLKDGVGLKATKLDVVDNPKNVEIVEVDAPNVPSTIEDVDYAVINANYALSNGLETKIITSENKDSDAAKTYANIVAVNKDDVDSEKIEVLVKALQTKKVKEFINKTYKGLVISIF